MFQMTIRASRATRLLAAVGVAWLGLALSAQAAHATYSKITIVKINQGGDQNDLFTFDTSLNPAPQPCRPSTIKAGQTPTASTSGRVQRHERVCPALGRLDADDQRAHGRRLHADGRRLPPHRRDRGRPQLPRRAGRHRISRRRHDLQLGDAEDRLQAQLGRVGEVLGHEHA